MTSPFTWDKTHPAGGDALNAYPALAQQDKTTLLAVLGTLVPFGTPTLGWRIWQDDNKIWLVTNAKLSAHAGVWSQDDNTADSYGFFADPTTNNSVQVIFMAAGQTTWTTLFELPKIASVVNWLQAIASATGVIVQQKVGGTDANVSVQSLPKGTGDWLVGVAAPATTATGGFARMGSMAGVPTGVPANIGSVGGAPHVWDDTDKRLYIYSPGAAAWQQIATPTFVLKKGSGLGNYTTSSATYVRVDTTNLVYAVTVPVGQKVLINVAFSGYNVTTGAGIFVALADGTADNAGILVETPITSPLGNFGVGGALSWVFVGDGSLHTFNLQFKISGGTTATLQNATATAVPTMTFYLGPAN